MEVLWKDHTLKVEGNWTGKWLFMAPEYQLWLDDQLLDSCSGPRLHPHLEAIYEDDDGGLHHIEAELLSVLGFRPQCEIRVEGEIIKEDHVRVQNFLNPFLMIFILLATAIMLYVGPDVVRQFMPV